MATIADRPMVSLFITRRATMPQRIMRRLTTRRSQFIQPRAITHQATPLRAIMAAAIRQQSASTLAPAGVITDIIVTTIILAHAGILRAR